MIHIEATYAATDGSAPESIRIEWDDNAPAPTEGLLCVLVDVLGKVAARYEVAVTDDAE